MPYSSPFPVAHLRVARKMKGWTLQYVADMVGVSNPAIHAIEMLKRKPSYEVAVRLEQLFNEPHLDLFREEIDIRRPSFTQHLHTSTQSNSNIQQKKEEKQNDGR